MPNTKSAKKYMRKTATNTSRNNTSKRAFRNAIKKVLQLVKEDKIDAAKKEFIVAQKALDKAVKRGVIKKNTAARSKSRIAKRLKK
jgi:small subunit ribosomal protein S20